MLGTNVPPQLKTDKMEGTQQKLGASTPFCPPVRMEILHRCTYVFAIQIQFLYQK